MTPELSGREPGCIGDLFREMLFATVTTVALLGSIDRAWAHPHVWVDAIAEFMLDDSHRLKAIRVYWAFDEVYSAIALEELHVEGDEEVEPGKLALLAAEILKKTERHRYFTYVKINGTLVAQQPPQEKAAYYINHRLLMYFVLPIVSAVDLRTAEVSFAMYDPTYYMAIDFVAKNPVRFNGSLPRHCTTRITEPAKDPGDVVPPPESFFQHLDPSIAYGAQFARWVRISCGSTRSLR